MTALDVTQPRGRAITSSESANLTDSQLDGLACCECGREDGPMVPSGSGSRGQLFRHAECGQRLRLVERPTPPPQGWRAPGRLTRLRIRQGLTQAGLAALLTDVTAPAIRRYEAGREEIPERLHHELAALFGVSVAHLLGLDREGAPRRGPGSEAEAMVLAAVATALSEAIAHPSLSPGWKGAFLQARVGIMSVIEPGE